MFGKSAYQQFSLSQDGFTHKGVRYFFTDVAHVFFARIHTTQRLNFVKVGEADSSYLTLILFDGKKLKITVNEAGFFFGWNKNKSNELDYLLKIYSIITENTFEQRLQEYLTQLDQLGYFIYDECLFNPNKKTITFKNKEFPLSSSQFLKGAGYIELRPREYGIANKIARELTLFKIPQFSTQTDTDVIFTLLKHYFNLTWK